MERKDGITITIPFSAMTQEVHEAVGTLTRLLAEKSWYTSTTEIEDAKHAKKTGLISVAGQKVIDQRKAHQTSLLSSSAKAVELYRDIVSEIPSLVGVRKRRHLMGFMDICLKNHDLSVHNKTGTQGINKWSVTLAFLKVLIQMLSPGGRQGGHWSKTGLQQEVALILGYDSISDAMFSTLRGHVTNVLNSKAMEPHLRNQRTSLPCDRLVSRVLVDGRTVFRLNLKALKG
jgi:hypothetical protein